MCTDKITGNYDLYFSPLSYHSNNKLTLDHHSLSTHISEYNNKLIKVTICYLSQKAVFTDPVQQMSTNKQERGGHTFWKLYSSFAIKLFMDAALKWTHLMNIIKKLSKSMKHFKYFVHTIQFFFTILLQIQLLLTNSQSSNERPTSFCFPGIMTR